MAANSNVKIVTVSQEMVALYLAEKAKPGSRSLPARVTADSKFNEIAKHFLNQFDARALLQALKHKNKKGVESDITLEWIVRRWLSMLDEPDAKIAERMMILDRLQQLILLGAIQDEALARSLQVRVSQERRPAYDPLAGEKKPQLSLVKGKIG